MEPEKPIKPPAIPGIEAALQRAAKAALELGLRTGTPVIVLRDGKMVDIAAERRAEMAAEAAEKAKRP